MNSSPSHIQYSTFNINTDGTESSTSVIIQRACVLSGV